jgi:hypothetical protein
MSKVEAALKFKPKKPLNVYFKLRTQKFKEYDSSLEGKVKA